MDTFDYEKLIASTEETHREILRLIAAECSKPIDFSTATPRLPEPQDDRGAELSVEPLTIEEVRATQQKLLGLLDAAKARFEAAKTAKTKRNRD